VKCAEPAPQVGDHLTENGVRNRENDRIALGIDQFILVWPFQPVDLHAIATQNVENECTGLGTVPRTSRQLHSAAGWQKAKEAKGAPCGRRS